VSLEVLPVLGMLWILGNAGLVTVVAYISIWLLTWLDHALFGGQGNFEVHALEQVHGLASRNVRSHCS
jgi:hypothetical protein